MPHFHSDDDRDAGLTEEAVADMFMGRFQPDLLANPKTGAVWVSKAAHDAVLAERSDLLDMNAQLCHEIDILTGSRRIWIDQHRGLSKRYADMTMRALAAERLVETSGADPEAAQRRSDTQLAEARTQARRADDLAAQLAAQRTLVGRLRARVEALTTELMEVRDQARQADERADAARNALNDGASWRHRWELANDRADIAESNARHRAEQLEKLREALAAADNIDPDHYRKLIDIERVLTEELGRAHDEIKRLRALKYSFADGGNAALMPGEVRVGMDVASPYLTGEWHVIGVEGGGSSVRLCQTQAGVPVSINVTPATIRIEETPF